MNENWRRFKQAWEIYLAIKTTGTDKATAEKYKAACSFTHWVKRRKKYITPLAGQAKEMNRKSIRSWKNSPTIVPTVAVRQFMLIGSLHVGKQKDSRLTSMIENFKFWQRNVTFHQ